MAVTHQPPMVEVGATGDDLDIWRAREAIRNAEMRLAVQVQAMQALEQRATTMIGWDVAGVLVVGAAAVGRFHPWAAAATAACLIISAVTCLVAISQRPWVGAGLHPRFLLEDESPSEYMALVGFAKAYQTAIETNSRQFHRFRRYLDGAIGLLMLAPVAGSLVLACAA